MPFPAARTAAAGWQLSVAGFPLDPRSPHREPGLGRRAVMLGAVAGTGALLAGPAEACSLTLVRRLPFRDEACRQRIRDWVALLDNGPAMTDEAIVAAAERLNAIDQPIVRAVLGDDADAGMPVSFYKEFRLSAGRPDTRPIRISEFNLLRRVGSRAAYQFTLERYSYHPADDEGCNGMFVHGEYYGVDRTAYLALFQNNEVQAIKWFEDWPLEGHE